jgi:glycosyltransferase involved in cell wall biosynthesis
MKKSKSNVSLIVTTYNRVDALSVVLHSILKQSVLPDEIIVADDGSTSSTKELIEKLNTISPIPLRHCWQEDEGFRLSTIRNKAISQAFLEYIIQIDGDIILHKHFIRDHIRIATRGKFIQGRRVLLSEDLTNRLLSGQKTQINFWSNGIKNRLNAYCNKFLSPVFSALFSKQSHWGIRTCNIAFWKSDAIAVNGFNEAFVGWGREDSEFVVRLFNSGIRRKDLRFGGVAYHLFHPENSRAMLEQNEKILQNTIDQQLKFCELGIDQYL